MLIINKVVLCHAPTQGGRTGLGHIGAAQDQISSAFVIWRAKDVRLFEISRKIMITTRRLVTNGFKNLDVSGLNSGRPLASVTVEDNIDMINHLCGLNRNE